MTPGLREAAERAGLRRGTSRGYTAWRRAGAVVIVFRPPLGWAWRSATRQPYVSAPSEADALRAVLRAMGADVRAGEGG